MKLLIFVAMAFIVGCASQSNKRDSGTVKVNTKAQAYLQGISRVNIDQTKQKSEVTCPDEMKSLEGKNWTRLVDYANVCVGQGRWPKVKAIGEKLARQDANSPWGPYYLSLVAEQERKLDRAYWMIELALKKAPQEGMLYYQKGRLHWQSKEHEMAVEAFEKSVSLGAGIVEANAILATIYMRDQEYRRAQEQFEIVLKSQPGHADSLVGMSRIKSINRDSAGAITFMRRAVEYKPGSPVYRVQLALLLEADSQFPEALDHFKRVQSQSRDTIIAGVNIKEKIASLKITVEQMQSATKVSQREPAKSKEVKGN